MFLNIKRLIRAPYTRIVVFWHISNHDTPNESDLL